jgi:predicted extracellular nuclease
VFLRRCVASAAAVLLALTLASHQSPTAQVSGAVTITALGVPATETFDLLVASGTATWTNNSTIPGWYHARTGTGTTIVANNGSNNAGNLYSYGTGAAMDRALGSVGSTNAAVGNLHWGVRIANSTGATITSLTVSYTGEQWRNSAAAAQTVEFSYLTGTGLGSALGDFTAAGVPVPQLSFTSPITGGTAGAIDGNGTGNRVAISHEITGLSLAPGQELLLRWSDIDHGGADHGLAIDDLAIVADGVISDVPALSINDVSVAEGNSGTMIARFTVSLSSGAHDGVTFDIATADGTGSNAATDADNDYEPRAAPGVQIPAGATTSTFEVEVNGDTTVEPDETFAVVVTNVNGATIADANGAGTITNDDEPPPVEGDVVISQVYGGGGNSGATFRNDFVELFNRGPAPVSLTGWSLQYGPATGTTWQVTLLTGSIAPGGYYLVQLASQAVVGAPLPPADATGTTNLAAGAGKIALQGTTAEIVGACPAGATADLVGYGGTANCFEGAGRAPAPSSTTAAFRTRGGCLDSDNNSVDFNIAPPAPRNTASPANSCTFTEVSIHDIQGPGLASPLAGQNVVTTGVVTGVKSNGFFLQEPDAEADADPNTSEAVFVFTSSTPAVVPGNAVSARGTVSEFFSLTQIESALPGDYVVTPGLVPLPTAVTLTPAILDPAGTVGQMERLEAMRVAAVSLTSVAPTDGFGEIATVLTGVARPLREPGIPVLDPVPPDPTDGTIEPGIPRFDENPERIFVDSDAIVGMPVIDVTSNAILSDVSGPLDFTFGRYKIAPVTAPVVSGGMTGVAVPTPGEDELTVGGFNIENFIATNQTQRRKAALAIRQLMQLPDVIGHIEILDLATLQSLADQVNADTPVGETNPAYEAVLIPAPAGGTQNVGFLVKTARVRIDGVAQELAGSTFVNPINGQTETLHDRPPLVLRATFLPDGPNPGSFIVVVNHLRSFIDIELVSGEGVRVRAKRKAQAEDTAGLLQALQTANPGVPVISVGDYNAYQFNDGYTDPIATLKGSPTPDAQVVVDDSPDLVNPNFTNLVDTLPAGERYSFIFEGTPQVLDHVLVNTTAASYNTRFAIARGNADFPEIPFYTGDPARPERASDHDMAVSYFRFPAPTADLRITLAASSTTAPAGSAVAYTAVVTNSGPFAAIDVVVASSTMTPTSPTTFATIPAGESRTVTFTGGVIPCSAANNSHVVTAATVASGTSDPDAGNNIVTAAVTVSNAPPTLSGVSASRTTLPLPLHLMVPVTINYTAADTCGAVTTTLSVTSDEAVTAPLSQQGLSGLTSPDWQVVDNHHVRLRAERSLRGDGRVYTISITATDAAGGTTVSTVTVTVPRRFLGFPPDID